MKNKIYVCRLSEENQQFHVNQVELNAYNDEVHHLAEIEMHCNTVQMNHLVSGQALLVYCSQYRLCYQSIVFGQQLEFEEFSDSSFNEIDEMNLPKDELVCTSRRSTAYLIGITRFGSTFLKFPPLHEVTCFCCKSATHKCSACLQLPDG